MFPNQKYIFKINLPPDEVKHKINRLTRLTIHNNHFSTQDNFLSLINSPVFGNMALIKGDIHEENLTTVLNIKVYLHFLGKIIIVVALVISFLSILQSILEFSFSGLYGLFATGFLYVFVLANFSIDSMHKINDIKKIFGLK